MYYSASELQARSGQNLCKLPEFQSLTLYILGTTALFILQSRLESNKCKPKWENGIPDSCVHIKYQTLSHPSLTVLISVNGKMRLHDFQVKMFSKHCLQNEMWLYRYLIEDNPRPYFINLTEYLKEASRIQYLHLKILFKGHFILSQC